MKKLLLTALFAVCAFTAFSQVTIRKPAFSVGMRVKTTQQGLKITAAQVKDTVGADKSWDFSTLEKNGNATTSEIELVAPSSTPYASNFAEANIAWKEVQVGKDTINYSYLKVDDAELTVYGSASLAGVNKFSDPMTVMKFPFAYNNSFNDKWALNPAQTFDQTAKYLAYGTLKTPQTTYNNVALVKVSRLLDLGAFKIKSEQLTWYTEGFEDVFSISISYPVGPVGETTYSASYDVNQPSSVENVAQNGQAVIYPNPTQGSVQVFNAGNLNEVSVSDLQGKTLSMQKLEAGENTVNLQSVPAGIYFIRLTATNDQVSTQKLIVE